MTLLSAATRCRATEARDARVGVVGFNAGTGYDQAMGLGSIDANNLATAFVTYVPEPWRADRHQRAGGCADDADDRPGGDLYGDGDAECRQRGADGHGHVHRGRRGHGAAVPMVAGVATTTFTFTSGTYTGDIANYSGDGSNYASISPTLTISNFNDAAARPRRRQRLHRM